MRSPGIGSGGKIPWRRRIRGERLERTRGLLFLIVFGLWRNSFGLGRKQSMLGEQSAKLGQVAGLPVNVVEPLQVLSHVVVNRATILRRSEKFAESVRERGHTRPVGEPAESGSLLGAAAGSQARPLCLLDPLIPVLSAARLCMLLRLPGLALGSVQLATTVALRHEILD